eukprot:6891968-Prymnesium_polylepis.1
MVMRLLKVGSGSPTTHSLYAAAGFVPAGSFYRSLHDRKSYSCCHVTLLRVRFFVRSCDPLSAVACFGTRFL